MSRIVESPLHYGAAGRAYRGLLLARDDAPATAAVVLLPDWRGQSDLARDHARVLVDAGCAVAVADLYGDGFSPTDPGQVGPMVKRLMEHREDGVAALSACVEALGERVGASVPVLCLGYSAGGMVALDYGRSGAKVAGIIVCSALLKTAAPGMSTRIAAPVLMLQGTQDEVSPVATIAEVIAEMDAAGNRFRIHLYGQTHHAFDNPQAGTDPTARLVYSPESARLARLAIAEFVAEQAGLNT
ncbi:MAG: dienelactone hydrolase family protein [Burkholderiaceae bacterium]